jgi:hypothetical protein
MFGDSREPSARQVSGGEGGAATLLMAGNVFRHRPPEIAPQLSARLLANSILAGAGAPLASVADSASRDAERMLAAALEDFRRLGALDLAMNYCLGPR